MIDSWNAAKLNERITQVEKKIQAADVEANPTGESSGVLNKVSIDGTVYSILPVSEDPTELYFDGTNWITKDLVWENEDDTDDLSSLLLDLSESEYNTLEVIVKLNKSIPTYIKLIIKLEDCNNKILFNNNTLVGSDSSWTLEWNFRLYSIASKVLTVGSGNWRKVVSGTYSTGTDNAIMVVSKIYAY